MSANYIKGSERIIRTPVVLQSQQRLLRAGKQAKLPLLVAFLKWEVGDGVLFLARLNQDSFDRLLESHRLPNS